jgi:hypothetical protein
LERAVAQNEFAPVVACTGAWRRTGYAGDIVSVFDERAREEVRWPTLNGTLWRSPVAPYKWDNNMKYSIMEVTSEIQKYISTRLVEADLKHRIEFPNWNSKTSGVYLSELYVDVRRFFSPRFDVPAGLFNKVIDDMSRIGLLSVNRKTKNVVNIAFDKLVSAEEAALLKSELRGGK